MNASEHMERVFSNGRNNLIRECMKHGERFCIEGPPGIGKTEEIKYEAARAGYEMYTNVNGKLLSTVWRMVRKERPDLQGAMVPDLVSGVTRELPLESLFALRNLPPDQKVCLFLDDYGQCPDDVQASGMGLFDENELPPNVLICAATNRIEDGAAVKGMISPMRSRFAAIFRVATPDVTDLTEGAATYLSPWSCNQIGNPCGECQVCRWIDWAFRIGAPPAYIAWHRLYHGRGMCHAGKKENGVGALWNWKKLASPSIRFEDYRTWHASIRFAQRGNWNLHMHSAILGRPCAAAFLAWRAIGDELPSLDEIRSNPKKAKVPSEPGELYMLCTTMATGFTMKDAEAWHTYSSRMDRIYSALLFRDCYARASDLTENGADKFCKTKAGSEWFLEHQDLFATADA